MNKRSPLNYLSPLSALILRLREHFPLTLQGVIALALMLLALEVFGYGAMDLVVFALAVCAIAILLCCLFCVIFGGLLQQIRVRRRILALTETSKPIKVEAGFPNETGFSLPALDIFPLIKLSWRIVYPDYLDTRIAISADDNLLVEEIIPRKRCKTARIVRLFTVSDVLGFCRYSWRQSQQTNLMALPQSNTIKQLPLLRSLTAEDGIPSPTGNPEGDRMEIRPYVPGDSVRNIMWKVYARNRQLNVRLAEKSVFHSHRTVAYLLASDNDEAAAAVARTAVESGALGDDWVFAADGTETSCVDTASALDAIAASRSLDEPFSYGLDNFLRQIASQAGSHCIVFAAAEAGPWIQNLKQTVGQFKGQFSLVLATDGLGDSAIPGFWQKLVFQQQQPGKAQKLGNSQIAAAQTGKADLGKLLTDLSQLVESTLVVDRNTGLSFDQTLRKV